MINTQSWKAIHFTCNYVLACWRSFVKVCLCVCVSSSANLHCLPYTCNLRRVIGVNSDTDLWQRTLLQCCKPPPPAAAGVLLYGMSAIEKKAASKLAVKATTWRRLSPQVEQICLACGLAKTGRRVRLQLDPVIILQTPAGAFFFLRSLITVLQTFFLL